MKKCCLMLSLSRVTSLIPRLSQYCLALSQVRLWTPPSQLRWYVCPPQWWLPATLVLTGGRNTDTILSVVMARSSSQMTGFLWLQPTSWNFTPSWQINNMSLKFWKMRTLHCRYYSTLPDNLLFQHHQVEVLAAPDLTRGRLPALSCLVTQ